MKAISKVLLALAIAAAAACSSMPDWMPGSGAIKVNLTGSEEVPPLSVPGSGSGSFRVADDGTITGSVTTKDVQGTMAHIHRGAKGTNGPVIIPLDKKGDTYSVPAGRKLRNELSNVCCVPSASIATSAPPPVRRFTSATTSTSR